MSQKAGGWRPVYRVVCRIPAGRVATYGQVAAMSGMPRAARQVGWALSALGEEDDVPWHRVINAQGEISPRGGPEIVDLQRALLENEGIEFNRRDRIDLDAYCWVPGRRKAREAAVTKSKAKTTGKTTSRSKNKQSPKKQVAKKQARKRKAPKKTAQTKPRKQRGNAR